MPSPARVSILKLVMFSSVLSPVWHAQADTIFSSLPAASTSDAAPALSSPTNPGMAYAAAFLATQSFRVQSVVLPGAFQQSPANTFNVSIFGSAEGLPGSSLATVSNLSGSSSGVNFSSLALNLTAGQTYWLVVTPNSASSTVALSTGTTSSPLATTSDLTGSSGWTSQGPAAVAYAIEGAVSAIPEPGTVLLTSLAFAGLCFVRRK